MVSSLRGWKSLLPGSSSAWGRELQLIGEDGPSAVRGGDVEESVAADRIIVVLLAVLRTGTIVLGAAEIAGSSGLLHPAAATATLLALAAQSAVTFTLAAQRMRRGVTPALDDRTAVTETVAGIAGLLVIAYATPLELRATSTFWIEPYTVISVLLLAASAQRMIAGAAGAACLTITYLACVFVWSTGRMQLSSAARATALTNAISYLPFFAIGAIGFAILRSVVRQTDALRRLLGRLSEERARVTAAKDAYRIGHDIPKALLREVRRGSLSTEELRPWARKFREDLLAALGHAERPVVSLREELIALANAFTAATTLIVDVEALDRVPVSAPRLLIAEAVRELLNNASYHAYGFPATLTARSSPEQVRVTVHNDGPGVDPAMVASAWARKQNTIHQLETAGGSYEIQSSAGPSGGTTVTLTWPAAVG